MENREEMFPSIAEAEEDYLEREKWRTHNLTIFNGVHYDVTQSQVVIELGIFDIYTIIFHLNKTSKKSHFHVLCTYLLIL